MELIGLSGELVFVLLVASTVLVGIMAGFFFAYSASVVLALETLSASAYTTVMQPINERVRNPAFGLAFLGAIVVPVVTAAVVVLQGDVTARYGSLFLAGVVVYLLGTVVVTVAVHLPMNDAIATWSTASPPDDWTAVRARWTLWNHVRTVAAIVSFVLSLAALVSYGG